MNPKELLEKLPLVRGWIDRTLAEHSNRAQPVASYRFPRLGGFYSSEFLTTAKVVEVERVPMPPLSALGITGFGEFETGNYAGITFLDTYFVQSGEVLRESLHFHELVHVVQWQHLGAERFVMAYALGYPERFAQEALGHNSKAVHRAYAKRALMKIPSLEDYEQQTHAKVELGV